MQRQSLGSPASKLHSHGGASSSALSSAKDDVLTVDESSSSKRRDSFLSSAHYDEDKPSRPHRLSLAAAAAASSSSSLPSSLSPRKPEKLVHLIPLLTLFCFLVLYLCSHSPSQTGSSSRPVVVLVSPLSFGSPIAEMIFLYSLVSDLAQFSGFKQPRKQTGRVQRRLEPADGTPFPDFPSSTDFFSCSDLIWFLLF